MIKASASATLAFILGTFLLLLQAWLLADACPTQRFPPEAYGGSGAIKAFVQDGEEVQN